MIDVQLHTDGGLQFGWHDWPYFAAFAIVMAVFWLLLRRYGKRWGK